MTRRKQRRARIQRNRWARIAAQHPQQQCTAARLRQMNPAEVWAEEYLEVRGMARRLLVRGVRRAMRHFFFNGPSVQMAVQFGARAQFSTGEVIRYEPMGVLTAYAAGGGR